MDDIFDKIWAREQWFSREKSREKKNPIDLFGPHYSVVLAEFTFFYSWKIKNKNDMKAQWFWENGGFLDNILAWEHRVFRRMDVFWQNNGMRAVFFSWKIRKKKGTLLTFLANKIV